MGKVIFLNRRYCPGEAWTNRILAYAKGFAEAGEEVVLYFIITDKRRTKPDINIPGVKMVNLWESDGPLARKFKAISFLKNLLRFPRMVKKGDKFFVYGGYEYLLRMALKVKERAKVFCEITEHPQIFGDSKSAKRANGRKIKMLKQLDGLFVISNSLKKYYIEQGISKETIHVINMFVDTGRFNIERDVSEERYIAYCGVVTYGKDGVDILLKAFSFFCKTHGDYKLMIIGRGANIVEISGLINLAKDLGISERVIFTGQVSPSDIPKLLKNASILALARPNSLQNRNGFPTKLGEYLATGNPVVATSVGEISNFLIDKENAILAKPGDPEDFAKQLCWVADNYEKAKIIGIQGLKLSNEAFSYKVQSQRALLFM
jgi:glycosyltransferase involved in cell wall biosynthesis